MGIAVERNLEIGSDFYRQECDRLRQVNAELVAALRDLLNCYRDETGTTGGRDGPDQREEVINARAALAKAKGE